MKKDSKNSRGLLIGGLAAGLVGLVALAFFVLPAICVPCAGWFGQAQPTPSSPPTAAVSQNLIVGINQGEQPPDFALTDIDGKSFNLRDFKGKPTVVYFSASWCTPCIHETEGLARLKDRYPDLNVIWISVDPSGDSTNSLHEYRQKYARASFIFALDKPSNDVSKEYQINATGTLYLLNRNQAITFKGVQPVETADFEQALKQVVP
ncbi:TlpA family protein disulfide reductase [Candidatus Acetothermia bacterium]|nr:TlpA family protein disulfide reductase [Candidatus Acetothermia bacterium]